jgi:hypothetical protein
VREARGSFDQEKLACYTAQAAQERSRTYAAIHLLQSKVVARYGGLKKYCCPGGSVSDENT